ncbi:MAG: adenylyl-sulfate kinase [Candidatus Moranbacteria bacterium]|nr:adenylyl-sulfate kinase [Candidatus Moranbacteria bacterium]
MRQKKGYVIWLTGLSGSGKTSIGQEVFLELKKRGYKIEFLDGDIIRKNLTKDLGFSRKDRKENIKRVAYVVELLSRNGVGVIACFISPYQKERDYVRKKSVNFIEVYVNTSLEICEKRDIKGLYKKARSGEIKNFTGISDPYERPKNPELIIKGTKPSDIHKNKNIIIKYLSENQYL